MQKGNADPTFILLVFLIAVVVWGLITMNWALMAVGFFGTYLLKAHAETEMEDSHGST
jgi:hypothetical protein